MPHTAALPFKLRRSEDVVDMMEVTSTTETWHGLLLLDGDRLVIQWRASRETETVGFTIRTDRQLDAVREVTVPLSVIAGAKVRWSWLHWPPGPRLFLTAADLRAFEEVAGEGGLRLKHPAELVIRLSRDLVIPAREFSTEVELALADRALRSAERRSELGAGPDL